MSKVTKFIEDRDYFPLWSLSTNLSSADIGNSMPAIAVPLTVPVTITTAAPAAPITVVPVTQNTNSASDTSRITDYTFKGISMSIYSTTGYQSPNYPILLKNAVSKGFTHVELSNYVQLDLETYTIKDCVIGPNWWENLTAPLSSVEYGIQLAQSHGLQVFLKPQLAVYDTVFNTIQHVCNPDMIIPNPEKFFATYKTYILEWAKLAEKYNVSMLSIGNEMGAVTKPEYTDYWYDIIKSVRDVYNGKLTYSALTSDVSDRWNEAVHVKFWDKLDYIGVDIYPDFPDITPKTGTASASQFNDGWKKLIYHDMLDKLATTYQKHIIFTETGVSSFSGSDGGGISNHLIRDVNTKTDWEHQANWYQSFFETWTGSNKPSWFEGMFFWNNNPDNAGDLNDLGYKNNYDIYGKPAEDVIASFLVTTPVAKAAESVNIDSLVSGLDTSSLTALLGPISYNTSYIF